MGSIHRNQRLTWPKYPSVVYSIVCTIACIRENRTASRFLPPLSVLPTSSRPLRLHLSPRYVTNCIDSSTCGTSLFRNHFGLRLGQNPSATTERLSCGSDTTQPDTSYTAHLFSTLLRTIFSRYPILLSSRKLVCVSRAAGHISRIRGECYLNRASTLGLSPYRKSLPYGQLFYY